MGRWLAVAVLATGCKGNQSAYCVGQVRAEDQGDVVDGGFHDPELVGTSICWGDPMPWSDCKDLGGTPGQAEDWDNAASFCSDQGYGVDCGGGGILFVQDASSCPATTFTTTPTGDTGAGT